MNGFDSAVAVETSDDLATDVDGHAVQLQSVGDDDSPANGTVAFDATSLRYTPAADFFGSDAVPYVVRDAAGATAAGTVTVTVNAVNDPPNIAFVGDTALSFDATGETQRVYAQVSDV